MVKTILLPANVQLDTPICRPVCAPATPNRLTMGDIPAIAQEFRRRVDEILAGNPEKEEKKLHYYLLFASAMSQIQDFFSWDSEWGREALADFYDEIRNGSALNLSRMPGDSTMKWVFSSGQFERVNDLIALIEGGCADPNELLAAILPVAHHTTMPWEPPSESENPFHIAYFALEDVKRWIDEGIFYDKVREQLEIIHGIRESFRSLIEDHLDDPFYRDLYDTLTSGYIEINGRSGISASYIVYDADGNKRFVLKPLDEDFGCINARPGYAAIEPVPFGEKDPYSTGPTDAFVWELARLAGLSDITPEAHLGIIESDLFWDMSKGLSDELKQEWIDKLGPVDFAKLVSVQRYLPESKQLWEVLQEMQMEGLTDEEIRAAFDQGDFEKAMVLELLSGDCDGHFGNFLAYVKGVTLEGEPIYGIQVIDNSYAFQSNNLRIINFLSSLPNADVHLSNEMRETILRLNVDEIDQMIDTYHLEYGKEAFHARVDALQAVIQENQDLTVGQLYDRFKEAL